MPKYNYGKIYKIASPNTSQIYIGSTTERYLCNRLSTHVYACRKYLETDDLKYVTSYDIIKMGGAYISLIEAYPCNDKDELRARERYWIEQHPNTVNKNKAYMSRDEALQLKKEYSMIYRANNPEIIKKNNVARKLKPDYVCTCGSKVVYQGKARHLRTQKHLQSIGQ